MCHDTERVRRTTAPRPGFGSLMNCGRCSCPSCRCTSIPIALGADDRACRIESAPMPSSMYCGVLRTGCQWQALDQTELCPHSTAHDRFQAWVEAGVFLTLWQAGVERFDELRGIEWDWLAMDGAMTKAPLGGGKNRTQSHRPGQVRRQTQRAHRGAGDPHRAG